jgi:hypothetical protein
VVDLLLESPKLKSLEVVARAKAAGYTGGKSALYQVIASIRPRRGRPLGAMGRVPGEIVRHGLGQLEVRMGGKVQTVNFVLSRLEYSHWATLSLVSDLGIEPIFRAMVRHYQRMGGIPLLAVFDRSKPFATSTDREGNATEWDPAFAYAAIQIGLGVEIRARRGADRGPGLNLGNWAKSGFLEGRVFRDEPDVEDGMRVWLDKTNELSVPELGGKSPVLLLAEERQRLRPLKVDPGALSLRFPIVVGPRSTVIFEDCAYPMPPDSIGLVGALYLYPSRVVIAAGRHEAVYARGNAELAPQHSRDHRPSSVNAESPRSRV